MCRMSMYKAGTSWKRQELTRKILASAWSIGDADVTINSPCGWPLEGQKGGGGSSRDGLGQGGNTRRGLPISSCYREPSHIFQW